MTSRVAVVGNPNAGKSTLFNRLTGGSARVGNYPGITVERTVGRRTLGDGREVDLVDVPGAYSIAARSPEEHLALREVLGLDRGGPPEALIAVVDAPRLQRGLYLVLQLLELEIPLVVAMNVMDEARDAGVAPDLDALSSALGVPVVGLVGRTGEGIEALDAALARVLREGRAPTSPASWPAELMRDAEDVAATMALTRGCAPGRRRALGLWALSSFDDAAEAAGHADPVVLASVRARALASGRDLDAEIAGVRYLWLDARQPLFVPSSPRPASGRQDSIDRWVLHPLGGAVIFAAVMIAVFMALFSWSDPAIGLIEEGFGLLGGAVTDLFDAWAGERFVVLRDLVVDGLIGGVGSVVVFVPQVALLFLFVALLEDCGYLARAATWMDRLLRLAGLPGQAFVPLLSGFACAVPAVVATRTLARRRDRLLAMAVLPLTSCSARLPVYALVIGAVLPAEWAAWPGIPVRPLMLFAMYLGSTVVTVAAAVVIGRLVLPEPPVQSVLELPPWRVPQARVVLRLVGARVGSFLREAGGVILAATVILWALLYFPRVTAEEVLAPEVLASATAEQIASLSAAAGLEQSYAGRIGKALEPAIAPLGFDWRIGIGLVGAFAAREVFVSTLGVVYGIADADEDNQALRDRIHAEVWEDGTPVWTARTGLSLMVFFALAMQCLSTLAVVRRESGSWGWTAFVVVYPTVLAWVASFLTYQGLGLVGFGA